MEVNLSRVFQKQKRKKTWRDSVSIHYIYICRIRFNDSWFIFRNSSWSFHEPYFSRKHIFLESYKVNRTHDYGLRTCIQVYTKLFNNVIILKTFSLTNSTITHFFNWVKVLKTLCFTELIITNWKDETINHSKIYVLLDLLCCQKSIS